MTICYLTPSDRTDVIPPPLLRRPKPPSDVDGRNTITQSEYQRLPAHEKAGFLLAHEKGIYFRKWEPQGDSHRAAVHRLVEAWESPTSDIDAMERKISRAKFLNKINEPELVPFNIDFSSGEVLPLNPVREFSPVPQVTPLGTYGTATVIQYREWSDEWRIRTETQGANLKPPTQSGERISELLSQNGAKKIAESCEYMSLKKGGYRTFATATFKPEVREKIAAGNTSIQKEVSRCMDAMQKMYQRGWTTESGEKIAGSKNGLCYCWVVEIPKDERGGDNPHVHLLMNWRVPFRMFADWAARIESIWGNGTMHLEKIKDAACAGAYMAKAAGYLTKAQGDDSQGKVRGNRYGISEPARAPSWVVIEKAQLHTMGQIIADVYDHLTMQYGADYRARKTIKAELDKTPKDNHAARKKIGERLQAVREKIKAIPIRCNKYQVILKGRSVAGAFITWAKGEKLNRPDWLPELPRELSWVEGRCPTLQDGLWWQDIKTKFREIKRRRHAWTDCMLAGLVEQLETFRADALSAWESYNLDLCQ